MADQVDIRIADFEDTLVIYFGTASPRINAYTLATTLIGLADAAKAANAAINPGHDLEIVVEAFGSGSFKATIRALYSRAGNLFSGTDLRAIILSIVAAFIYERTLASSPNVTVNVSGDEVVIVQGTTRVVIPRAVHEETRRLASNSGFIDGMGTAFRAIEADSEVKSLGMTPDSDQQKPPLELPHEVFASLAQTVAEPTSDERCVDETTELQILRAILERGPRMWQFAWRGVRISAPVTDGLFYDRFFRHQIRIAPGDVLKAHLRIRQARSPDLGVFINKSYEVIEVLEHIPRAEQIPLTEK